MKKVVCERGFSVDCNTPIKLSFPQHLTNNLIICNEVPTYRLFCSQPPSSPFCFGYLSFYSFIYVMSLSLY